MFINPTVTKELYKEAGEKRYQKAEQYVKERRVTITNICYEDGNNFTISALVKGNEEYSVYVQVVNAEINDVTCNCEDYQTHYAACKHVISTILEVDGNPKYSKKELEEKPRERYTDFKELVQSFYEEEMKLIQTPEELPKNLDTNIQVIPKLIYDSYAKELRVEFKIGTAKQFYKLKDLTQFYQRMHSKQIYSYGEKLKFEHTIENFEEKTRALVHCILKYAEVISYINKDAEKHHYVGKAVNQSSIALSHTVLDELFSILESQTILIEKDYFPQEITLVAKEPEIQFELAKIDEKEYKVLCNIETYHSYEIFEGKEYSYFLYEDKLYQCSKKYEATTLKMLETFRKNFTREIKFDKTQLANFFSIIYPKIEKQVVLDAVDLEEIEQYMPQKLGVKVFLEFNQKNYIVAKVIFCYGEEEFNPLEKNPISPRNVLEEVESLNIFLKTGFLLDRKNSVFVLNTEEKIYEFLTENIAYYMQKFEILATEDFKEKQIRKPKMDTLGVRIENNLLTLDLNEFNFDKAELKEILKKYRLKKKYHRLKDGTFLSLEENEDIEFIDNLVMGTEIDEKEVIGNRIQIPVHRSLYLNKILEKLNHVEIQKDTAYTSIVKQLDKKEEKIPIPEELEEILRVYQKTGYRWLKALDEYAFSGILADDMGLGKTLQMIAMILSYKQSKELNRQPILVICPSSLSLNWRNEITKFVPEIQSMVITGNAEQRRQQIHHIPQYDVVITSYDLLKRDIELYLELDYEFRYVIADEAQYIKNSNTQNAKAIKQIKAKTRYALTGTPIENSLSELWSIFDFLMPGYLFSYRKFKEYYELPIMRENSTQAMQKLKMLIEPFILRRTKKEVLTELPDKTITILDNEMETEQQKMYLSYLAQARNELKEEVESNGFENSQIKILALLTRLRQICCHPSLFVENYKGESSKLLQCMEIVKEAIQSGHKILLFSGYTSMFDLIEKEFKKEKIRYFKLTGQTKVSQRIELVDQFNEDPDIKVFLISLKAGGTGLNLTGADMVIHYDPWWNLSAENQATDRAYRIGQKNNVQVYKLITKNSIEEKIYELQEKKAKLIDNVLDTKTSFINKLSKEDIMKLFE